MPSYKQLVDDELWHAKKEILRLENQLKEKDEAAKEQADYWHRWNRRAAKRIEELEALIDRALFHHYSDEEGTAMHAVIQDMRKAREGK
jgi:predicted  nucleic acid-binding Zn-ribbon protein